MGGCLGTSRNRSSSSAINSNSNEDGRRISVVLAEQRRLRTINVSSSTNSATQRNENAFGANTSLPHYPIKQERLRWKSNASMTETQLRRKRENFWETAPTLEGRQEVWDALRAAAHAYEAQDYAMCQALLDAANIRLGSGGCLTEAWDESGSMYKIPPYCLAAPANLRSDPSIDNSSGSADCDVKNGGTCDIAENGGDVSVSNVEEIGKQFQIKLRFHYFDVRTGEDDRREAKPMPELPTKDLKFQVNSKEAISSAKKRVRDQYVPGFDWRSQSWLFGGRMLLDKQRLDSTKLQQGFVVQVIIRDREATKRLQALVTSKKDRKKKDKKKLLKQKESSQDKDGAASSTLSKPFEEDNKKSVNPASSSTSDSLPLNNPNQPVTSSSTNT